jgi:hypothetical protein
MLPKAFASNKDEIASNFLLQPAPLFDRDGRSSVPTCLPEKQRAQCRTRLTRRCSDLKSSAARPDFIARFRPAFGETVEGHKPEISETRTGIFETDLQSSPLAHIP